MPDKKKTVKFPPGATQELKVSEKSVKGDRWAQGTEDLVTQLAQSQWHSHNSRPRVDGHGYFLVLHWYNKEQTWVPLYLQQAQVGAQLTRLFCNREKEPTPIGKYLSSFPRLQRKFIWLKWLIGSSSTNGKTPIPFRDVLEAFSAKYNNGEILAFNTVDDQSEVPDNFSLLDY